MLGYKVPSSLIEKIERETYHIGDFSYLNGMDKVLDSIKELGEVELDNPWHTGTPTEEGWYVIKTKHGSLFLVQKNSHGFWIEDKFGYEALVPTEGYIVAWMPIEPYKED